MDPLLSSTFDLLSDLHDQAKNLISDLGQEALDWSPGPEMNSMAVLAAHIAGAEKFWIREIVMETPIGRDRDKEFATSSVGAESLISQLDGSLADVQDAFESLTSANLWEPRAAPRPRAEVTVAWTVAHTLRHTALHLGHMEITRQLLELRQTD